jgi:hypothetical protein
MQDVNNPTGSAGLVAVDKRGCRALFLDPTSYAQIASMELPARPHEVAIRADHCAAYVSIYGSGVYGNNPIPDHRIVVLDLGTRQLRETMDVQPFAAQHGLAFGADGLLYVSCDASGVVAVLDSSTGMLQGSIDVGSKGNHMIAMLPADDLRGCARPNGRGLPPRRAHGSGCQPRIGPHHRG